MSWGLPAMKCDLWSLKFHQCFRLLNSWATPNDFFFLCVFGSNMFDVKMAKYPCVISKGFKMMSAVNLTFWEIYQYFKNLAIRVSFQNSLGRNMSQVVHIFQQWNKVFSKNKQILSKLVGFVSKSESIKCKKIKDFFTVSHIIFLNQNSISLLMKT